MIRKDNAVQQARAIARWLRSALPPAAAAGAVFLLAQPLLQVLHALVVVSTAGLLRGITSFLPLRELLLGLPLDPIYTGAALETLGSAKVAGIAVAGPVGGLLHGLLPAVFASPDLANGALAQAALLPGSTVIARTLSTFAGQAFQLLVGILIVHYALRGSAGLRAILRSPNRRLSILIFGLLTQLFVALSIVHQPPSLVDLEALGVSFAFGVLFPSLTGRKAALSDLRDTIPGPLLTLVLALLALFAAYSVATILWRLAVLANRRLSALERSLPPSRLRPRHTRRLASGFAVGAVTLLLMGGLFAAQATPDESPAVFSATGDSPASADSPRSESVASPSIPVLGQTEQPPPVAADPPGPSVVTISGRDYNYIYRVNGVPQLIRGMGYNPMYAKLDRAERARRYDRDFLQMRLAGVNTVYGWINEEFDDLTIDKAQEHGLGMAMPFHLSPALDYSNQEVQAKTTKEVLAWVETHKRHPALRMWTIGNEVLHKIVYSSWLPARWNSTQAVAQARAFTTFYLNLIDQVHQADPDHPVVLRDAEDGYLQWIREVYKREKVHRPWFVYGVNVYTNRLKDLVANWRKSEVDTALLISEFAQGGLGPKDRPEGYRKMWEQIRRHPDWTLGGVPYVWTTAGPEEVDRAFGLVDANGKPVDGSLEAITRMFGGASAAPLGRTLVQ